MDHFGIEVRTGALDDDVLCFVGGHGLAIRPIASQGIVNISNGDDARLQRYLFSGGRVITRTVKTIVVGDGSAIAG